MSTTARAAEARGRDTPPLLLSVLIPAYKYADGVGRIVGPLLQERRNDIEIVVADDSDDNSVADRLLPLLDRYAALAYVHNVPAKGAVGNWNSLLSHARGQYVVVMHHDDFPLSAQFASQLIVELEAANWPDAVVLGSVAHDIGRNRIRRPVPHWIRNLILVHWPGYLLRRNVVGPPGAFVVRRDLFEGFDPALRWLVDVAAYGRFLQGAQRRLAFSRQVLVSSTGQPNSITAGLHASVKEVTRSEIEHLRRAWPTGVPIPVCLRLTVPRWFTWFEPLLWATLKTCSLVANTGPWARPHLRDVLRRKAMSLPSIDST